MLQPLRALALPTYKLAQTQMEIGEKSPVSPKLFNQLEGRTPTPNCLLMCKDTPRFVARSTQVTDRLVAVTRLLKVMCQCCQMRLQAVLVNFFDCRSDLAMQLDAPIRCQVIVEHFTDERVGELMARDPRRSSSQNSDPCCFICLFNYLLRRARGDPLQQSRLELIPDHRRDR